MNRFDSVLEEVLDGRLTGADIRTIQANVGLRCNQECAHCHLEASPTRTEMMDWDTMEAVVAAAQECECELVDVTGGAPELHPELRRFVLTLRDADLRVRARTNLTAFLEEDLEDLPAFYRDHQVQLVASMPCYLEENVRAQRGPGVYEGSVEAIRRLNALGYGEDPDLALNLVYNPGGPALPPEQSGLESDYKRELGERFGIAFTHLFTMTNMPIGRFLETLREEHRDREYAVLLEGSFNEQTVDGLMCRHQVCVAWDGALYDCDFNLALGYSVDHGVPAHIRRFDPDVLAQRRIVTGDHCFGCTAGAGSSCGGALA